MELPLNQPIAQGLKAKQKDRIKRIRGLEKVKYKKDQLSQKEIPVQFLYNQEKNHSFARLDP